MTDINAATKLAAARRTARMKLPYWGIVINALAPVEVPGLGTWGVTERMVLIYDPKTLTDWSVRKCSFVYAHEVAHIVLRHALRARRAKVKTDDEREDWNVASDCQINDILRAVFGWVPEDACTSANMNLDPNASTEVAYAELRKRRQDEQGESSPGEGPGGTSPGTCAGRCGSGAGGKPLPGEPSGDHPASRTMAEVETASHSAARMTAEHAAKHPGTLPGQLARDVAALLAPPEVSWQQKLARAARRAGAWQSGKQDYRWDGMSVRQGAAGYGHGCAILPRLRAPKLVAEFWCDTSGSMSTNDLRVAMSEARGVLKAIGARVRFVAVDTKIHASREVASIEQMVNLLKGGGGTDFASAFADLTKRKIKPSVVVFATDGYASGVPASAPRHTRVIWLLVGSAPQRPCTWGDFVTTGGSA